MTSLRLMAVGDIMLGDHPLSIGWGVGSIIREKGVDHPFSGVVRLLRSADLAFGNLETVLSSDGNLERSIGSVTMRGHPNAAEGLANAGLRVVSVANNHMFDHGVAAVLDTLSCLSKNDIEYFGLDTDLNPRTNSIILTHDDVRVALLAYCLIPGTDDRGFFARTDDEICDDVTRAKKLADVVVISIHWGDEYVDRPSPAQIQLAHRIVDSGASLIIGHHPHVLQGLEEYHDGLIAYSLGNFVFDLDFLERTKEGVILECELSKEGVIAHHLHPTRIDFEHVPRLLAGGEETVPLARLGELANELEMWNPANVEEEKARYAKEMLDVRRDVRMRMAVYFLANIHRYAPRFSLEMTARFLGKKVGKVLR